MRMQRCGLIAIILGGATAVAEPPPHDTPKNVQQLAVEAQQEFRTLSKSLEQSAKARLVEVRKNLAKDSPRIGLDWVMGKGDWKLFVAPEQVLRKNPDPGSNSFGFGASFLSPNGERLVYDHFPTKKVYTLEACQMSYRLEFRRVRRVYRTGLMETPFAGEVEFAVTTVSRSQSKRHSVPLAAPKHYRLSKKGDLPFDFMPLRQLVMAPGEEEEVEEIFDDGPFDLPLPARGFDPPAEAQAAADKLLKACPKAKPTESTEIQTVMFRYWPAEKRWDWRTDQEHRSDVERAKKSEKPSQDRPQK